MQDLDSRWAAEPITAALGLYSRKVTVESVPERKYRVFSNHSGPGFSFFDMPGALKGCSDAPNALNPFIPINYGQIDKFIYLQ